MSIWSANDSPQQWQRGLEDGVSYRLAFHLFSCCGAAGKLQSRLEEIEFTIKIHHPVLLHRLSLKRKTDVITAQLSIYHDVGVLIRASINWWRSWNCLWRNPRTLKAQRIIYKMGLGNHLSAAMWYINKVCHKKPSKCDVYCYTGPGAPVPCAFLLSTSVPINSTEVTACS